MSGLLSALLIFTTALICSLGLVPVLRRWAMKAGALDAPDERKVHKKAIPRLGGVAIYVSFLFSSLIFAKLSPEVRGILVGGLIVFFVGLIDDLYGLTPRRKFSGEIAAVLITILISRLYLVDLGNLFGFGDVVLPLWLGIPFTVFCVVGVINAINLIDGLDGLSGGISVIALASFMVLSVYAGYQDLLLLCAGMLGSLLGFLKYNFYPARIFMGDAGSLSLGFVLGFMAIYLTQPATSDISPMIPVVILGVPIADALWVMMRRIVKGKRPFSPDMTHVHHKFLNLGFKHRFTVILIYGVSLFWALFALSVPDWPEYQLLCAYLAVSAVSYILLRYLIMNREHYPFMSRDSSAGLRESRIYRWLADRVDRVTPVLQILLVVYLLMAIVGDFGDIRRNLWALLALVAGIGLYWLFRHSRRHYIGRTFVLSLFYLAGLVVALLVDRSDMVHPYLAKGEMLIFSLIAALVIMKILFRCVGEFFVETPELIVLISGVFALVAFSQIPQLRHLSSVPIRGGVLFLAINMGCCQGRITRFLCGRVDGH
ncbi:MAG: hypothetical protein C0622_03380 [Desulfuromonas sp.]|nr:MAG: hypothetical protein C0622_03380 [Desulfuromonas sp.]